VEAHRYTAHGPGWSGHFRPHGHSLTGAWAAYWPDSRLPGLARVPGAVAWAVLVLPLAGWVSLRLARCTERGPLLYPYLLWLTAGATFLPAISNDYNLVFLPLAALAVWDPRDALPVHAVLGCLFVWWQPLQLPVEPYLFLLLKLAGFAAVGFSLAGRVPSLALQACVLAGRPGAVGGGPGRSAA
jgi:hypothetical protein